MKIGILGAGSWGTTLAIILSPKSETVYLWSHRRAADISARRENVRYLPGVKLPENIKVTGNLDDIAELDLSFLFFVIPTQYLRSVVKNFHWHYKRPPIVVSAVKGIEERTFKRPSEILCEYLPIEHPVVLGGPTIANEIVRGLPTAIVCASEDEPSAYAVQQLLNSHYLRAYRHTDVVGVELASALKNIIAIAAGIVQGLSLGANALGALLTRGLTEIRRFGIAHGARVETFSGLAGMGDLITTAVSSFSRNRYVGVEIGRGKKLSEILSNMVMVAEGIWTTRSVLSMADKLGITMPITREVYAILFEDKPPATAIETLMARDLKFED